MKYYLILIILLIVACAPQTMEEEQIIKEPVLEKEIQELPRTPPEQPLPPLSDQEQTKEESEVLTVTKQQIQIDHLITIGDSLTYGHGLESPETQAWPSLLNQQFLKAKLHNSAKSGETSFGTVYQVQEFEKLQLPEENNKLIFLWTGANDIASFISLQEFEQNYRSMVDILTKTPNSRLILFTIPDVSKLQIADAVSEEINAIASQLGFKVEAKKIGQDLITTYNEVIFTVAKEKNLPVIDMFSLMKDFDQSLISKDEFHPNKEGHKELRKIISQELLKSFPRTEYH